jgi:predicted MFS family arabinose efflux permease
VALTAIHSWAQFILFAYLTPVLEQRTGAGTTLVALALGLFGLCGIAGNVVAMRLMDRISPRHATTLAIGCMFAGQVVIAAGGFGALPMLLGLSLLGLGCFSANSAQQARLLAAAPALASVSIALNSSAIYLGQAAGAETGAWIIGVAGMDWLPRAGLPVFVVALALSQRAGRAHR